MEQGHSYNLILKLKEIADNEERNSLVFLFVAWGPKASMRAAEIVSKYKAVAYIRWHDPRYSKSPQLLRALGIMIASLGGIQQPGEFSY